MSGQTQLAQDHAETMEPYVEEGILRAGALGNRGAVSFDKNGKLASHILDAYWETGFYVFEGLVDSEEIELLRSEMTELLDRAPVDTDSKVDRLGRPAFGQEFARPVYSLVKPLSDPWGGTELLSGRHPVQMSQPEPQEGLPEKVVFIMSGMCQTMESGLRLYGHPNLLAIAGSINGDDFVPFNDATFVKQPGVGGSVSWHQDGVTHWKAKNWDEGIHGFNFQVQLYQTTPRSCLWVVPGTHKLGKIDIKERVRANPDGERLPEAVPLYCQPGDVTIVNRQALHCSFANTSPDLRVSLTFGFHRRKSVLGAKGALSENSETVYDEQRVHERSEVIGIAIDARSQFYAEEPRYCYEPLVGQEGSVAYNEENWARVVKDYNLKDLSI
jgi:hypothetical protein